MSKQHPALGFEVSVAFLVDAPLPVPASTTVYLIHVETETLLQRPAAMQIAKPFADTHLLHPIRLQIIV